MGELPLVAVDPARGLLTHDLLDELGDGVGAACNGGLRSPGDEVLVEASTPPRRSALPLTPRPSPVGGVPTSASCPELLISSVDLWDRRRADAPEFAPGGDLARGRGAQAFAPGPVTPPPPGGPGDSGHGPGGDNSSSPRAQQEPRPAAESGGGGGPPGRGAPGCGGPGSAPPFSGGPPPPPCAGSPGSGGRGGAVGEGIGDGGRSGAHGAVALSTFAAPTGAAGAIDFTRPSPMVASIWAVTAPITPGAPPGASVPWGTMVPAAGDGCGAGAAAATAAGTDAEVRRLRAHYEWQVRRQDEELRALQQRMGRLEQRRAEVRERWERERQGLVREISRYVAVLARYAIPLEEACEDPSLDHPWVPSDRGDRIASDGSWKRELDLVVPNGHGTLSQPGGGGGSGHGARRGGAHRGAVAKCAGSSPQEKGGAPSSSSSSLDAKMRRLNGLLSERQPVREREPAVSSADVAEMVPAGTGEGGGVHMLAGSIASTLQAMFPHATVRTRPAVERPDEEAGAEVRRLALDLERATRSQIDERALRALQGLSPADACEVLRKVDDLVRAQGGRCRNLSSILQSVCRKLERRAAAGRGDGGASAAADGAAGLREVAASASRATPGWGSGGDAEPRGNTGFGGGGAGAATASSGTSEEEERGGAGESMDEEDAIGDSAEAGSRVRSGPEAVTRAWRTRPRRRRAVARGAGSDPGDDTEGDDAEGRADRAGALGAGETEDRGGGGGSAGGGGDAAEEAAGGGGGPPPRRRGGDGDRDGRDRGDDSADAGSSGASAEEGLQDGGSSGAGAAGGGEDAAAGGGRGAGRRRRQRVPPRPPPTLGEDGPKSCSSGAGAARDHWTTRRVERAAARGCEMRRRGDRWELKLAMGSLDPPLSEAGVERYCRWLRTRLEALREEHGARTLRRCCGEIDFSNNNLGNQAVWTLLETLAQFEVHAASLKLYKNRISQGGVLAICEFVRTNKRAQAVYEMHLSHNEIDDDSAHELVRTLHQQKSRYPPRRACEGAEGGTAVVPVWVRLNHNRIRDPVAMLRVLEAEGITFCAARNSHGCGPGKCSRTDSPLAHLYLFTDQAPRRRSEQQLDTVDGGGGGGGPVAAGARGEAGAGDGGAGDGTRRKRGRKSRQREGGGGGGSGAAVEGIAAGRQKPPRCESCGGNAGAYEDSGAAVPSPQQPIQHQ